MELTKLSIEKFVEATASSDPVPGGGSISALCGALSAALAHMVAGLTIGRKKYADVQPIMEEIAEKAGKTISALTTAIDEDSQAYDMVFQAYKLPKDNEQEQAARAEAIQAALKHAAAVPLQVATLSASLFDLLRQLAKSGNRNAITDAYVATLCARTAVLGAAANTRINLMSITDTDYVETTTALVKALEEQADDAERNISAIVNPEIGK